MVDKKQGRTTYVSKGKKKEKIIIRPSSHISIKRKSKYKKYSYIPFFLFVLIVGRLAMIYFVENGEIPSAEITNSFAVNYIEWSGILYSIVVSSIIVKAWEMLDNIDREFDREASAIRLLYEDLQFLRGKNKLIGQKIAALLRLYVRHVIKNYKFELKDTKEERIYGDEVLINIRKQFRNLISPKERNGKPSEFFIEEILQRLNGIIDIRGNRIALASQRLFVTFQFLNIVTSILFIIPFYVLGFSIQTTHLDNILIVGVTLLVIFVYVMIKDFNEPFGDTWKIGDESWQLLRQHMICEERKRRLKKLSKKEKRVHRAE